MGTVNTNDNPWDASYSVAADDGTGGSGSGGKGSWDSAANFDWQTVASLGGSNMLGAIGRSIYPEAPDFAKIMMSPFTQQAGNPNAQAAFLQSMQGAAAGQGPSAAAMLMKAAQDRNAAQAMGLARGSAGLGGVAAGSAARNAMNAGQQGGLQSQQQLGAMRAQEQIAAQQQLGQYLAQLRQQDLDRQKAEAESLAKATEMQYDAKSKRSGGLLSAFGSIFS